MPLDKDKQAEVDERAGIMEFCGGLDRREAERLARERPWDKDPYWGMPKPEQIEMFDENSLPPYLQRIREKYCKG